MKFKRFFALLLIAAMAVGTIGCTAQENGQAATDTQTATVSVTDMMGREVVIDEPVDRIVAVTASDCEILYALGAENLLVGRGEYCDYPEEVSDIPVVQSGDGTNVEEIIALDPQVVLMSDMAQTEEQVNAIEQAGIAVVQTQSTNIDGVYKAIQLIGEVVDKDAEADALVKSMQKRFADVAAIAQQSNAQGKSIYFEISPLEFGLWSAGEGTFMDEIADMLMLDNIFADVTDWAQVSQEQVIERDPEVIVTVSMDLGEGPAPTEEIKARTGWETITAVKNDDVYQIDNDSFTRPGPRLADAAEDLCELIYG